MKCQYDNFECDWPVSTGDIECAECAHYIKKVKSASIPYWIKELLNKLFNKKLKNPI